MKKRQAKSGDPIKSAKRVLDQIIAKHDPESVSKKKRKGAAKKSAPKSIVG